MHPINLICWVYVLFHINSTYQITQCFLTSRLIFSLTLWLFRSLISFHIFVSFPNFFLLLTANFTPLWWKNIFCIISISLNSLNFYTGWNILQMSVRSIDLYCSFLVLSCWLSANISINYKLRYWILQLLLLYYFFISVRLWFTYFNAFLLNIYVYNCDSFLMGQHFIFIKYSSASPVTFFLFVLKSIFVGWTLVLTLWVWYIFFHPFTFNLFVALNLMCVTCRQHISWIFFLIQSDKFCLLIGLFHLFTSMILLIWLDYIWHLTLFSVSCIFYFFFSCFLLHM